MKIRCIKMLNLSGEEVNSSRWIAIGNIYHVMSILFEPDGRRSYGIVTDKFADEWPSLRSFPAECFEIVSTVVPSNWQVWIHADSKVIGISPASWQCENFEEKFYNHDSRAYPTFEHERQIVIDEDL